MPKASGCSLSDEAFKHFVTKTFHHDRLREDAKQNRYNLKHSSFGSLYKDRTEKTFLLYSEKDGEWMIEENKTKMKETFTSFEEGEKFLKRNYAAWLVRDDAFVNYLLEEVKEKQEE